MAVNKMEKIIFSEIDQWIKQGQLDQAKQALNGIDPRALSRSEVVDYCALLRRAGLILKALEVLHPVIYPKGRKIVQAHESEKLEYASSLVRLEIFTEAERILQTVTVHSHPEVLIRRSFIRIAYWDYEQANHLLMNYIEHPKAQPYEKLIAQVNLLQGLVSLEKTQEARELLRSLIQNLDAEKNKFLLSAVYEFAAELERINKDYKSALGWIEKAKVLLRDSKSIDGFLLRKQEALVLCYSPRGQKHIPLLLELQKEAQQIKQYESFRDLDLHLALLTQDLSRLNKVYWGSSSEFFKQRVLNLATAQRLKVQTDSYQFKKNKGVCFDLQSGNMKSLAASQSPTSMKSQQAVHRLLRTFLCEFYKPLQLMDLFNGVFPNEIFFPQSSADKMYQLLKRARQFLKNSDLPLTIHYQKKNYKLKIEGNFTLTAGISFSAPWEKQLRDQFKHKRFQVEETMQLWSCSYRTAMRRLQTMKQQNKLIKVGETRAAHFKWTD